MTAVLVLVVALIALKLWIDRKGFGKILTATIDPNARLS